MASHKRMKAEAEGENETGTVRFKNKYLIKESMITWANNDDQIEQRRKEWLFALVQVLDK